MIASGVFSIPHEFSSSAQLAMEYVYLELCTCGCLNEQYMQTSIRDDFDAHVIESYKWILNL